MSPPTDTPISPREYLVRERRAHYKTEYLAGELRAMTGASRAHNLIVTNIVAGLAGQPKGRPCEVYPSDMRVHVRATGLYAYPDVSVVCGEPVLEDEHRDTLLNPTLLVEVLSESTEEYDRGTRAEHYRRLDSLRELLLVSQDEARVQRCRRRTGDDWAWTESRGLDHMLELPSIGCTLALAEVYERVL